MPEKGHYTSNRLVAIRIEVLGAVGADPLACILFFRKAQAQFIIITGNYLR